MYKSYFVKICATHFCTNDVSITRCKTMVLPRDFYSTPLFESQADVRGAVLFVIMSVQFDMDSVAMLFLFWFFNHCHIHVDTFLQIFRSATPGKQENQNNGKDELVHTA